MMFKLGMKTGKVLGRLSEKFGRFGKQKPLKAKLTRFKNQSKKLDLKLVLLLNNNLKINMILLKEIYH